MNNEARKKLESGYYLLLCPFCYAKGINQALESGDGPMALCPKEHGEFPYENIFNDNWYKKILSGEIKDP
jgi:hypothetical protein